MHLFLTADPGAGKSFALDRALELLRPQALGGFRTLTLPSQLPATLGEVYIAPAGGPLTPHRDCLVGVRWGQGQFTAFKEGFELGGCRILAQKPPACDLLLMDELGMMERHSPNFATAVLAALEGPTPIIGAIKPAYKSTPMLEAVRRHPQVEIITLTLSNRDALPALIAGKLSGQLTARD